MSKRNRKNPNGEGTIYQRKDGRFEAAVYVTTTEGTRKRVRVYGATWEHVHQRLVELKAQDHRGIPVPAQSYTLAGYLDEWLEHGSGQPCGRRRTRSTRLSCGCISSQASAPSG